MSLHRRASIWAQKLSKRGKAFARIEQLESRCMLTTLFGQGMGTTMDPYTGQTVPYPWASTSYYRNAADDVYQVTVAGNVTAVFVSAVVDPQTGVVTLRDLVGENELDPANLAQKLKGADLFAVYVQKADINSFIAITRVARDQNTGKITLQPFNDSAGTLRVISAKNGQVITVDTAANTGKLYLGARTVQLQNPGGGGGQQNSDNIPILNALVTTQIPDLPQKVGDTLSAGIVVADGQDLGKFLFGGTITGQVTIGGSMSLFACGQLLTGTAGGGYISSAPSQTPNNFTVKGDLRDLVVVGPIGTNTGADFENPSYLTRFELKVGGRLGQVKTYDSFTGLVNVLGNQGVTTNSTTELEIENRTENNTPTTWLSFDRGLLVDATFYNDTPDTAQYFGSFASAELGKNDVVQVRGELAATDKIRDFADYYAVALNAGQTVEVHLIDLMLAGFAPTPTTMLIPNVVIAVFDPDGRIIATNYSNVDRETTETSPFRFTTDRPGIYKFAVGLYGETIFSGTALGPQVRFRSIVDYEIRLSNLGAITLGAVAATNHLFDPNYGSAGFTVESGDLGAIVATGTLLGYSKLLPLNTTAMMPTSVEVLNGNLHTLQGSDIGLLRNGFFGYGMGVHVPAGNVGLVRSTTGILIFNDDFMPTNYMPTLVPPTTPQPPLAIVGGDYQMVDAATTLYANIVANRKIGVIRAGDMATRPASLIMANYDQIGDDGVIDLIDVTGTLGTLMAGGPYILTGPGGNVRYMNVGGTVYRDALFGGGIAPATAYQPGEAVTLNDDSGSAVTLSPTSPFGVLTVTTYGIRGSGGVVAIRVDATSGVSVTGSADSPAAGAEIGAIRIDPGTPGPGIVQLANGQFMLDPYAPPLAVDINGKGRVDVLNVVGPRFTRIANYTTGEIVNVLADSIGTIEGQTLGLASHSTDSAVLPRNAVVPAFLANPASYPFDDQRVGIVASDILTVSSRGPLGNIIASPAVANDFGTRVFAGWGGGGGAGNIQQIITDSDNTRSKTLFEGIVAPIFASGTINSVNIGAGITYGGSGNMALSGIFANGPINAVEGKNGADIRGLVVSGTRVGSIRLVSGSLIGAEVFTITPLDMARKMIGAKTYPGAGGTGPTPTYQINSILIEGGAATPATGTPTSGKRGRRVRVDLRGKKGGGTTPPPAPAYLPGGIIGSFIGGANIGTVKVTGGFGIINTYFHTSPTGIVDRVQADGYGIRDSIVDAGLRINNIVAVGDGKLIPVTNFSTSVRGSESAADPNAPLPLNRTTDLYKFLEIPTTTPSVNGRTNSGVIAGLRANALRDLRLLQAWRFQGGIPDTRFQVPIITFSTLNFANSIKTINIAQDISDVQIVTGAMNLFSAGNDVLNLDMTVAGPIKTINAGRNFNKKSRIRAIGPDGSIGSIYVGRNYAGLIEAQRKIGTITVKGKFTGKIMEAGKLRTK